MGMCADIFLTEPCDTDLRNSGKLIVRKHVHKEDWVRFYSDRMLKLCLRWQTCLGVASNYLEHLKKDLPESYEEPLKETFIETTY